jgi:hypothetical protein
MVKPTKMAVTNTDHRICRNALQWLPDRQMTLSVNNTISTLTTTSAKKI